MPISNDSLNKKLYQLLKVQGFDPVPKNSKGDTTPVPDDADVFRFTFKIDGKPAGPAWVTVDSNQELKVYYDDEVMDGLNEDGGEGHIDSFTEFLQQLKRWAQRRQLGFDLENQDHLESDMAQREHVKKQEQVNEGYYPMGKSASYNDSVPSVKIILQHTRQIQEGEQRFRNIARIFLENTVGERILAPTTRPGIAKVYARHLAEGGLPHDERWNHIGGLVEEYTKMAGFVRATRGNQFNESAQQLVNEGINHYQSLRETLSRMIGHKGYNTYFESWTPALMEDETDNDTLNELFVQETMDPRIESVMPILSRIHKKVNEMSEVKALEEWANTIIEDESRTSNNPEGIPEEINEGHMGDADMIIQDLISGDRDIYTVMNHPEGPEEEYISKMLLDMYDDVANDSRLHPDDDFEQIIDLMGDRLAQEYGHKEVDEALDPEKRSRLDDLIDQYRTATDPDDYYDRGDYEPEEIIDMIRQEFGDNVAGQVEAGADKMHFPRHGTQRSDPLAWKKHKGQNRVTKGGKLFKQDSDYMKNTIKGRYNNSGKSATEGVAEDLDSNQKRVGQLGPTEKVKNNNIGKLVGASESVEQGVAEGTYSKDVERAFPGGKASGVKTGASAPKGTSTMPKDKAKAKGKPAGTLSEMDSEGYKGTRDEETKGPEGKATPIKADKAKKDFAKMFQKNIDKANKAKQDTDKKVSQHQEVKEGQEDLDAILRIIRK